MRKNCWKFAKNWQKLMLARIYHIQTLGIMRSTFYSFTSNYCLFKSYSVFQNWMFKKKRSLTKMKPSAGIIKEWLGKMSSPENNSIWYEFATQAVDLIFFVRFLNKGYYINYYLNLNIPLITPPLICLTPCNLHGQAGEEKRRDCKTSGKN